MAVVSCKECKGPVSTQADACPHCGAKRPRTSGCAKLVLAGLVFFVFMAILGTCMGPPPSSKDAADKQAAEKQAASQPEKKSDPAAEAAEATAAMDVIEARLKENGESLKKYYASPDKVKQSTADIIMLAVYKGYYEQPKDPAHKAIGQRAVRLIPKVEQQARELYASAMAEIFVKNGMDVEVTARGKEKKQLRIKYALMSKPLVYKFQNEMELDSTAKQHGFNKIVYTNGFDSSLGESWTVDL